MPLMTKTSPIYEWPEFSVNTDLDRAFVRWAELVRDEIQPVREALAQPLSDEPTLIDKEVTEHIEGWLPRVASLAVTAEYFLTQAKLEKWPTKERAVDGKALVTEKDREFIQDAALSQYRFVRDLLDAYVTSMRDRMRWAQSVRKPVAEGQTGF